MRVCVCVSLVAGVPNTGLASNDFPGVALGGCIQKRCHQETSSNPVALKVRVLFGILGSLFS